MDQWISGNIPATNSVQGELWSSLVYNNEIHTDMNHRSLLGHVVFVKTRFVGLNCKYLSKFINQEKSFCAGYPPQHIKC